MHGFYLEVMNLGHSSRKGVSSMGGSVYQSFSTIPKVWVQGSGRVYTSITVPHTSRIF